MIQCKICGKELYCNNSIGIHIKFHKISSEEYYNNYIKTDDKEGICQNPSCNCKTKFLGIFSGYRKYCSAKCNANSTETINKRYKTCNEKYGNIIAANSNEGKLKVKNTKFIKYGDENYNNREQYKETLKERYDVINVSQLQETKDKIIKTSLEKYGTKSPNQSEIIKKKQKETLYKNYKVTNPLKSDIIKEKVQMTNLNLYGNICSLQSKHAKENYQKEQDKSCKLTYTNLYKTGEILQQNNGIIKFRCNICNKILEEQAKFWKQRVRTLINPCLNCLSKNKNYSLEEKQLLNEIKLIYQDEIIENDRNILNGKELDIYIPKLNIGIEFDGSYWHADPRLFNSTTLIEGDTAKDIWLKDFNKIELCESKNIKLIRIREFDWKKIKETILNKIKILLNTTNWSYFDTISFVQTGSFREAKQLLQNIENDPFLTEERVAKYIAMMDAADAIDYATDEEYYYTTSENV